MPIDSVEHDYGVVVNISGIFDRTTSTALEDVIRTESKKGKNIAVNLYDVNYISSVSIGTLIRLHGDLAEEDIKMAVSNISEECQKIFNMVEVDKVIPIYENDEQAFEKLNN